MHRDQANLGSETDDHQGKGSLGQGWVHLCANRRQLAVARHEILAQSRHRRDVEHHDAEQADGQPGRTDHQVLPARLKRGIVALAGHQQSGHHGRQLDGDPQNRQVVDQGRGQQRQPEQVEQRPVEATQADVADSRTQVAGRIDAYQGIDEGDSEQEDAAQGVHVDRGPQGALAMLSVEGEDHHQCRGQRAQACDDRDRG